jgi:hypothetical protein
MASAHQRALLMASFDVTSAVVFRATVRLPLWVVLPLPVLAGANTWRLQNNSPGCPSRYEFADRDDGDCVPCEAPSFRMGTRPHLSCRFRKRAREETSVVLVAGDGIGRDRVRLP